MTRFFALALLLLLVVAASPVVAETEPLPWPGIPVPDTQRLLKIQSTLLIDPDAPGGAVDIRTKVTDELSFVLTLTGDERELLLLVETSGNRELAIRQIRFRTPEKTVLYPVASRDIQAQSFEEPNGKVTWIERWTTKVLLKEPPQATSSAAPPSVDLARLYTLLSSKQLILDFEGKTTKRSTQPSLEVCERQRGVLEYYVALEAGVVKLEDLH